MNTEFLNHLAEQLLRGNDPACRRAIDRILMGMKERAQRDEFASQSEAERIFRDLVAVEPACLEQES